MGSGPASMLVVTLAHQMGPPDVEPHVPYHMKIKFLPLLLVSALCAALFSGCNTTRGVGKDIEKAGDKIQDASR